MNTVAKLFIIILLFSTRAFTQFGQNIVQYEDFDWEYKETRDNLLDRTEALAMKRAIGHPTDLLGNNMETPKERVERWNFEINN